MKKISLFYLIIITSVIFTSCELDELPKASVGKDAIFGSRRIENLYLVFYNMMPSGSDLNQIEIDLVDFGSYK